MAQLALQSGASGPAVTQLQQTLVGMGFVSIAVDGSYGPETAAAVASYQDTQGLPSTGIVDEATANALGIPMPDVTVAPPAPIDLPGTTITVAVPKPANYLPLIGLFALFAGAIYYYSKKGGRKSTEEYEEWEEPMPDEQEDEEDPPRRKLKRVKAKSKFADDVTDSLIDEPAIIAESRRPKDCHKAALLLVSRSGLVRSDKERKIYQNVISSVKNSCSDGDSKKAVQRAIHQTEADAHRIHTFFETKKPAKKSTPKGKRAQELRAEETASEEDLFLRPESHAEKATTQKRHTIGRPRKSSVVVRPAEGDPYRLVREARKDRPKGYRMKKIPLT